MEVSADATLTLNGQLSIQVFTKEEIEEAEDLWLQSISLTEKRWPTGVLRTNRSKSEWVTFPAAREIGRRRESQSRLLSGRSIAGEYWWSADSKEIYYTEDDDDNPNDASEYNDDHGGPCDWRQASRAFWSPTGFLGISSADQSKRLLACVSESNATPWNVALADLSTGEIRTLVGC